MIALPPLPAPTTATRTVAPKSLTSISSRPSRPGRTGRHALEVPFNTLSVLRISVAVLLRTPEMAWQFTPRLPEPPVEVFRPRASKPGTLIHQSLDFPSERHRAGDVFATAFFIHCSREGDPLESRGLRRLCRARKSLKLLASPGQKG